MPDRSSIESILHEDAPFPPPPDFAANAHIKSFEEYEELYAEAAADPEAFWAKQAESSTGSENGIRCSNGMSHLPNGLWAV